MSPVIRTRDLHDSRARFLDRRDAVLAAAAVNGSTEETGCGRSLSSRAKSDVLERCVCDAGGGGRLSLPGAGGIGGGFFRGGEFVRAVFRGAGAEAEIR